MTRVYPKAVLLLLSAASNVTATDNNSVSTCEVSTSLTAGCFVKAVCYEAISDAGFPEDCLISANNNGTIDLTLSTTTTTVTDWSHVGNILSRITNFKLKSAETFPNLGILKYMIGLEILRLNKNNFVNISGSPFLELTKLKHIDLSFNNLHDINDLFKFNNIPKIRYLSLAHNQINEFASDTFSQLINLISLDLSDNNIVHLNNHHFKKLTSLKHLNLNNNNINNLDGVVNELDNLEILYANNNDLVYFDRKSDNTTYHLAILDLSGNRIENIRNDSFIRHWTHFRGSCKILMSSNQIKYVPKVSSEIGKRFIRHIDENKNDFDTEIDLSNNSISRIEPDAFKYVINIVTLNLASNNLTTFDVNSEHLTRVEFLNLSNNHIYYLHPHSFGFMNNLQFLDLSNNSLVYNTAQELLVTGYLKSLNLSWNYFDHLRNLHIRKFHPGGGILDLSNNRLSHLRLAHTDTKNLRELILNWNNIQDASSIKIYHLKDLKRLEIRNNPIHELNSSLLLPPNLEFLDLSHNEIEVIGPDTFNSVQQLKELCLRNNRLSSINYGSFQGLKELINLDLSHNNIKYLNSAVLMELVSLQNLFLKYTGIHYIDYGEWLSHDYTIYVYLEGSEYTCDELNKALKDYFNKFSKMRPTVSRRVTYQPSLEGIPCKPSEAHSLTSSNRIDERLLMINQQILEAIRNQTFVLNEYLWQANVQPNTLGGMDDYLRTKRIASEPSSYSKE